MFKMSGKIASMLNHRASSVDIKGIYWQLGTAIRVCCALCTM
uniref:Uncharacterized protein n=1 Tax=Anguilla anguilla TaxID=7936 RepID=A0A0E9PEM0_ANGAN